MEVRPGDSNVAQLVKHALIPITLGGVGGGQAENLYKTP
jgi:hypothetical protein